MGKARALLAEPLVETTLNWIAVSTVLFPFFLSLLPASLFLSPSLLEKKGMCQILAHVPR